MAAVAAAESRVYRVNGETIDGRICSSHSYMIDAK
jgi:sRNA-binding regulator protein Hfq